MKFRKGDLVVPSDMDFPPTCLNMLGLTANKVYQVLDAFQDKASTAGSGFSVYGRNDRGEQWIYDEQMFFLSRRNA
jgi:hypothetical protein